MVKGRAVPLIDLSPFATGSASEGDQVITQVADALESIGFLVISNHGIAQDLIDRMYAVSGEFFDLPLQEKIKIAGPKNASHGYRPVGADATARSLGQDTPPDIKEKFQIGHPDVPENDYYTGQEGGRFFPQNLWPASPAALRDVWTEYYAAVSGLGARLQRIFARALSLPANFFDDKFDKHPSSLTVVNYPEQEQPPLPGQLRAGAHSDFGFLTILYKDPGEGSLQVEVDGEWVDVDPIPGTFIINIGDLTARWTNDRWVSTMHRVVNPPAGRSSDRRMSIVFFYGPNYDTVISPLPSCVSESNPAKYPSTTAGEYRRYKIQQVIEAAASSR